MVCFSVIIVKQRLFTGAVGIPHIVPLSVNKITGIKNIKEVVEERDRFKKEYTLMLSQI